MKPPAAKPCKECPFRRKSLAGYVGNDTPRRFVAVAQFAEVPLPCHCKVNYERKDWKRQADRAPLCAGFATFLANMIKSPRNAEIRKLLDDVKPDRKNIFATPAEMLAHHCPKDSKPIMFDELLELLHAKDE